MRRKKRSFFSIIRNGDGTVDVFLDPTVHVYHTDCGIDEYDISVPVIKGVVPFEGMENHIREHYHHWQEIAETIWL